LRYCEANRSTIDYERWIVSALQTLDYLIPNDETEALKSEASKMLEAEFSRLQSLKAEEWERQKKMALLEDRMSVHTQELRKPHDSPTVDTSTVYLIACYCGLR
jgi:hypothetical protein